MMYTLFSHAHALSQRPGPKNAIAKKSHASDTAASLHLMAIIIFIGMLIVFAGLFLWMLNAMLRSTCPVCRADRSEGDDGPEATVIPVIPGFLWWCPDCNSTIRQNKLVLRSGIHQD